MTGLATTSLVDQPKTPPVQAKRSPDPLCPLKTTDVPFFLAHISSVDDDNEGSDSFCKYLPICINNYTCSALVDSGNIWRNAISKDFAFNQMKLTEADIRPLSTDLTLGKVVSMTNRQLIITHARASIMSSILMTLI
jgi:hypothetical protein